MNLLLYIFFLPVVYVVAHAQRFIAQFLRNTRPNAKIQRNQLHVRLQDEEIVDRRFAQASNRCEFIKFNVKMLML